MVDFICVGLVDLRGTQNKRDLQNEKFLVQRETSILKFEARPPRLLD